MDDLTPHEVQAGILRECSGAWRTARAMADALGQPRRRVSMHLATMLARGQVRRERAGADDPDASGWVWLATGLSLPPPSAGIGSTMRQHIGPRILAAMAAGATTASAIARATCSTRVQTDGRLRQLARAGVVRSDGGRWVVVGDIPPPAPSRPPPDTTTRRASVLSVLTESYEPMTMVDVAGAVRAPVSTVGRDLRVLAQVGQIVSVGQTDTGAVLWVAA